MVRKTEGNVTTISFDSIHEAVQFLKNTERTPFYQTNHLSDEISDWCTKFTGTKTFDEAMKIDNINKYGLLNGGVSSDSSKNPIMYFCTIGDGVIDDNGKLWTTSNMYEIQFYSGCKGVTIYKSNTISIHYRCFCCGGSLEMFGREHFSAGCRVYEEMDVDEVLKNLVNKNWNKYHNIVHSNPYNIKFLKAMKQRLIKSLECNKIINWDREQKRYVDYKYYKMFH